MTSEKWTSSEEPKNDQSSNEHSSEQEAKQGRDGDAGLQHLVGIKDKMNIESMVRYDYVDNESYDSRPNGWRVKGSNEPPISKETERSGEIEIGSDRDQRDREIKVDRDQRYREIERLIEIKDHEIEINREGDILREIERDIMIKKEIKRDLERMGLRVTGTDEPVGMLELDGGLRKEQVSRSDCATNDTQSKTVKPSECMGTLEVRRWLMAATAA